MDFYIYYTKLPEGKLFPDFVEELNEVLDGRGSVCGGEDTAEEHRLDLELEEETVNPKYAQMAVKNYLQRAGFPQDTRVEFGGMEIGIYE